MELREERICDTYAELDQLVREYFAATVASEDVPPLDFNWPAYDTMNVRGQVRLFTARHEDKLAGFVMYVIAPHLHHRNVLNAACDTLAVRLDMRGHGLGRALMAHAEPILKSAGVRYITHQFRTCYKTKPLFPKLGYKLIEYGYLKELN